MQAYVALLTMVVCSSATTVPTLLQDGFTAEDYVPDPPNFPAEIRQEDQLQVAIDSDVLRQYYRVSPGYRFVFRTRSEREDASSSWDTKTGVYTTAYIICDSSPREGGDELVISGIKDDGESVVELWRWSYEPGRQVARYTGGAGGNPPSIGVPQGSFTIDIGPVGGEWIASPQRREPPSKITLYEGPLGPFTRICADPEGRFVLMYSFSDKSIYRLEPGGAPIPLLALTNYPTLDQVGDIDVKEWPGEGRKYIVYRNYAGPSDMSTEVYTILNDDDNDGNFNSVTPFTHAQLLASPYGNFGDWISLWKAN